MRHSSTLFFAGLALSTAVCTPQSANTQSVWQKMKDTAKQQACRNGDQKACQDIAQHGQQQPQQRPSPGQPAQKPSKPGQPTQASGSQINDTGPFTPPPDVKIEPTIMAPVQQGAQVAVSPSGVHVATLSHSGSRAVVIYDGVPGPKFDQIFMQGMTGPVGVVFSPDGRRFAYCAQSGSEWVVMVDGKELTRGPGSASGEIGADNCRLGFTSNSKHVYFFSDVKIPPNSSAVRFVFDGKSGPLGAPSDNRAYAFSPDGNHFAYIWEDPKENQNNPHTELFIDNQPAPYNAGEPQWTADSQHLFTKRVVRVPNSRNGTAMEVLYDGKPFLRADAVTLYIPPVGNMVIAKVTKSVSPPTSLLVIGNKVIPGSESLAGTISDVMFSPDGKHFAAVYSIGTGGRQVAFIDGKKGLEYARLDGLNAPGAGLNGRIAFTADSSKAVYVGFSATDNGQFVVYDGQESDELIPITETAVAPVGNHVATEGWGDVTMDGRLLHLAGVTNPHAVQARALSFSPDASHYAFVLTDHGNATLYLDGVPQTGNRFAGGGPLDNVSTHPYIWSPDSKHIAYFCRSANPAAGDDEFLCVDNKMTRIGSPNSYFALTFTSDSNHLIWARNVGQNMVRIFVDGKPVEEDFIGLGTLFVKETWQMGPDGNLLVLLQDQNAMKRVSITPSPDGSFAAMFGGPTVASGR